MPAVIAAARSLLLASDALPQLLYWAGRGMALRERENVVQPLAFLQHLLNCYDLLPKDDAEGQAQAARCTAQVLCFDKLGCVPFMLDLIALGVVPTVAICSCNSCSTTTILPPKDERASEGQAKQQGATCCVQCCAVLGM